MFDVKYFYPSFTQDLLKNTLNFANNYNILKCKTDIIHHARKSLMFDSSQIWIKKQRGLFDVTMGAYERAEVCELVGTYVLKVLSKEYIKNKFGLYRGDGLVVSRNKNWPQSEQIKVLDVTVNINDEYYKPYTNPNTKIKYIHKDSNHPSSIIRQIPLSIESKLFALSYSKKIFQEAIPSFQKASQNSGYPSLTYKRAINVLINNTA